MKIVLGFAAAAALSLVMGGCSSSSEGDGFGPGPDLASVQSRFDKPDGTFNANNAAHVLESGTNDGSSASDLNFSGAGASGSGSSSTKSARNLGLHVLDATSGKPSPFACSALTSGQTTGSCACPGGGSIDYQINSSGQGAVRDALMTFRMSQCTSGETTIDGNEYLDVRSDSTDQQHPSFAMLLMIDATVTHAGQTKHIDLQARYGTGTYEIAVKVDDGWVIVSLKQGANGGSTWSVRDRNGSWTCSMQDGHGSCTSDKGETKKF